MTRNLQNAKLKPIIPKGTKPDTLRQEINSFEGRLAEFITDFSGSMSFVYFHAVWFFLWVVINKGLIKSIQPFDPFPYGLLTMIVSLEAIFLSTFILIAQNRQELIDTYRDLEEEQEEREEDKEQEELEKDVDEIQKDLDDIKEAIAYIQRKITTVERTKSNRNGNGSGTPTPSAA